MTTLKVHNPFNAPVYHKETVASTMDVSRQLALKGEMHGTVISADFQEAGRGRIQGRIWQMDRKINLAFTVLLRYPNIEDIPPALTLRTGLAVSLAIEDFSASLKGLVQVKWPNDIMINNKKTAGILCEAENGNVHIGIGINVAQKEFPSHLCKKATSIAAAASTQIMDEDRFILLEKILMQLFNELHVINKSNWKVRLEKRLYKKGEQVIFIEGQAGSKKEIAGCLLGITDSGELLIMPKGESSARSFITGELIL